jgi:hypothetical protein
MEATAIARLLRIDAINDRDGSKAALTPPKHYFCCYPNNGHEATARQHVRSVLPKLEVALFIDHGISASAADFVPTRKLPVFYDPVDDVAAGVLKKNIAGAVAVVIARLRRNAASIQFAKQVPVYPLYGGATGWAKAESVPLVRLDDLP